jgi:hypothetical protein
MYNYEQYCDRFNYLVKNSGYSTKEDIEKFVGKKLSPDEFVESMRRYFKACRGEYKVLDPAYGGSEESVYLPKDRATKVSSEMFGKMVAIGIFTLMNGFTVTFPDPFED